MAGIYEFELFDADPNKNPDLANVLLLPLYDND